MAACRIAPGGARRRCRRDGHHGSDPAHASFYREYRKLKASLRAERPDLAILIDFPDVNLSLAAELRRLNIPVVYFVSPQIWAWKKWRMRGVKRNVTRMLVIFPFEEDFYRYPRNRRRLCRSSAGRP